MITTIIVFVIILGLLVFVHELGHFGVAKAFKIGVDEFGFGFPPRLFGFKFRKTIYSLNWIPIGGFVKIKGIVGGDQAGEEKKENKKDDDNFINKPIWQRFAVLFAGVFMNFILCGLLYSVGFMIGLPAALDNVPSSAVIKNEKILILEVLPDMPAERAGLQASDFIEKINGQEVSTVDQFKKILSSQNGAEVTFLVERAGEILEQKVAVENIAPDNTPGIGIYLTEAGTVSYPWYSAIYHGFKQTFVVVGMIFKSLYDIITSLFIKEKIAPEFSGPIGIAVLTSQVTKMGFIYILQFTALLSINLAIFNLLPLPALDGGRLIFLIIEKMRGKAVNQKIEAIVHNIGFAFLLLLIVLVTFKDISRYQIIDYVKNIFS
jgi:regulator of sigma E protease